MTPRSDVATFSNVVFEFVSLNVFASVTVNIFHVGSEHLFSGYYQCF